MDDQSNAVRPKSAFKKRRDRSRSLDMNTHTDHKQQALRMYTACGILGAWTRVEWDSEEEEDDSEERQPRGSGGGMVWPHSEQKDESLASDVNLSDERKRAAFEEMQKVSGEKVLSRLRERQQSLEGERQQTHSQLPEGLLSPAMKRSLPRKLLPLWRQMSSP